MRTKWLTAGVGVGVGAVMLLVSGLSAMANTSGYDAYKEALKNTKAKASLTANADLTVTDNGRKVLSGTADIKLNHALNTGSMAAVFGNGALTRSLNVFRQDGKVIFKTGEDDIYRVMEQNGSKWQHEGDRPNPPKAAEQVFDALMGNVRELATVESKPDGSKQAELHVSGSQIPAIVNAMGSFVASKAASGDHWDHGNWSQAGNSSFPASDLKVNLPKLTDHIKVEGINLDAKISPDLVLERQTADMTITGTDDSGKQHVLTLRLRIDFSGFNETAPKRIDLAGKQTLDIHNDGANRGWHH